MLEARGQQDFSEKAQIVNILCFVGHIFCIVTNRLFQCSTKAWVVNYIFVLPTNSYIETVIPSWMVFCGRTFGRILGHENGSPVYRPIEEKSEIISLAAMWEPSKKAAICKLRREASPVPSKHASTMISDFPDSRTRSNTCLLFPAPSLWCFISVVLTDEDSNCKQSLST